MFQQNERNLHRDTKVAGITKGIHTITVVNCRREKKGEEILVD